MILNGGEVIKTYTEENGLTYPIILCLCESKDGTLYAVAAEKPGKLVMYLIEIGVENYNSRISSEVIKAVVHFHRVYHLTKLDTGDVSTFNAIAEDNNGNLWAAALNGVGPLESISKL